MENPKECNHCGSENIDFKQQMTFSYWYCYDCKEEVDPSKKFNEVKVGVDYGVDEEGETYGLPYSVQSSSIPDNPNGNSPLLPANVITEKDLEAFCRALLDVENQPTPAVMKSFIFEDTGSYYKVTVKYTHLQDSASFIKNFERELELRIPVGTMMFSFRVIQFSDETVLNFELRGHGMASNSQNNSQPSFP